MQTKEGLIQENQKLNARIEELEETFRAIRQDSVDALIINTPSGDRIFTLKDADQWYRSLIEQMKEGAALLSKDYTILYSNSSLARILRKPLERLISSSLQEHLTPIDRKTFEEFGKAGKEKLNFELSFRRDNGELVPVMVSLNNVKADGTEATYMVVTDLTEHMAEEVREYTQKLEKEVEKRRRLQAQLEETSVKVREYAYQMQELAEERLKQLKEAERLAAIGQTAGMVGHDIRNPLQAMVGELYLANAEACLLPPSEQKQNILESLESIRKSADYINKIVADLQDFAKPIHPDRKMVNLKNTVNETLKSIGIPENITTQTRIPKNFPPIFVDPSLFQRILTNLITNAIQAIQEKGEITINASHKNNLANINIIDTGTGICDDAKSKIFQPLFTTKAKGQGFGLTVVKRFVEAQDGTISFTSQKGKGTTFTITLPTQNPEI